MNTFNFLISALCLASAATCDATKIAIKDNVNFVLKFGTCNTDADIKVKFVNGIATVLSSTSAAALAASGTLGAGGSPGPEVKNEKEGGAVASAESSTPESVNPTVPAAASSANAASAKVEAETKSINQISELVNTSEDVGEILIKAYPFPGHFKIPSLKYKSINIKGKKKTVYEVYITPLNVHMSADERHSEDKNFTVKVDFKCNKVKNEK
ncbi:hypothetical protein DSO57_1001613 [Entomophthora muscae]|uniref:Uncharacterized protein n=1 Tax=Entomophthora muscae TaxID=34485 RepID=A0ACC2S046_9FUNG|nr:hypothetical protein DSO57_1001613 [Entomophthora muscae]